MGRGRRPGLRWKLVFALVATSGLTLLVAVLALLPPLQSRLERDRLNALHTSAQEKDATLQSFPPDAFTAGSVRLDRLVHDLARRTGAHVAIFDAQGSALADSDPDDRVSPAGRAQQTQDAALARAGVGRVAVSRGDALIVRPEELRSGRITLVLRKPLGDTRAAFTIVRSGLPLAAAIALAIALLVGILVSFRLLRRLERLRQGVRTMQEQGIDHSLPTDGSSDEVGEVTRAVEAMRVRLSDDERARQEFLSTASHELRTPVASLQGTLELLEEELGAEELDLAGARRRAAGAVRQSRRLAQLTADLLDLSRLEGELRLRHDPVELGSLVTAVLSDHEGQLASPGASAVTGPPGGVWARGDAPTIARIVRILLDNALRYAPDQLPELSYGGGGADVAWVRVADRGPGVAPGERERIFQRFERGSAGEAAPGFGLGLAIARPFARRMGGDLVVEDRTGGATFALRLPGGTPDG